MKDARLQLRVEKDLKERAEKVAEKMGQSLSFLVNQYLEDLVEQDQQVVGDEDGVRQI